MIYDLYLRVKHRRRLTQFGKLVLAWLPISAPWILHLAWYSVTGNEIDRLDLLTHLSATASAVTAFIGLMLYSEGSTDDPMWHLLKERE